MSQKSFDKSPTLYLIATPIGNMDDITFRAIDILNQVEVIFSEDTRVTSLLLKKHNLKKKLIANHQYNEKENKEKLLSYLKEGKDVGLVTDRGTPIISDPGYELSQIAIENGYNVVAIPGATALISALIVSGISPQPFTFYGFLNSKETKRKKELENLKRLPTTLIFYEAPHRITETITNMLEVFGNRSCSISREITKRYEEVFRGTFSEVLKQIDNIKGEIVIIVDKAQNITNYDNLSVIEHVNLYIKEGMIPKDAIKQVAKDRQLNKNEVYMQYHIDKEV
ncbi:MAG: 16S rRNA (cytidine(1402)-2'-O)-methyltransferase [Bacilli bacterium]